MGCGNSTTFATTREYNSPIVNSQVIKKGSSSNGAASKQEDVKYRWNIQNGAETNLAETGSRDRAGESKMKQGTESVSSWQYNDAVEGNQNVKRTSPGQSGNENFKNGIKDKTEERCSYKQDISVLSREVSFDDNGSVKDIEAIQNDTRAHQGQSGVGDVENEFKDRTEGQCASFQDIDSVIYRVSSREQGFDDHTETAKDLEDIESAIRTYQGQHGKENLERKLKEGTGESFIHTAIRMLSFQRIHGEELEDIEHHYRIVAKLTLSFRKYIATFNRKGAESDVYSGQTPLHMAITKDNIRLISMLMTAIHNSMTPAQEQEDLLLKHSMHEAKSYLKGATELTQCSNEVKEDLDELLQSRAEGSAFKNTVMMSQIPLSVAALSMNKPVFNLLLHYGAKLDGTNGYGDNVCHSLVRYSWLFPEKTEKVIDMLQFIATREKNSNNDVGINERNHLRSSKLWIMENFEGKTPLQLATKLGLDKVTNFINGIYGQDGNKQVMSGMQSELEETRELVEYLRREACLARMRMSECLDELIEFIEDGELTDVLVTGFANSSNNPWARKSKEYLPDGVNNST